MPGQIQNILFKKAVPHCLIDGRLSRAHSRDRMQMTGDIDAPRRSTKERRNFIIIAFFGTHRQAWQMGGGSLTGEFFSEIPVAF